MQKLLASTVLLEGITHIEDLPLRDFIRTVEEFQDKVVTEKLDGSNLWFGVDETGFFTSREGKSKKTSRFYSVADYPLIAAYNGFRAAHLALEQVKTTILSMLDPGDMVETEILFGRQPNTVIYGAEEKNYIVILRGIGTDPKKVDALADSLHKKKNIKITSTVISSSDGNKLDHTEETLTWDFTQVRPVDNSKIESQAATDKLSELKSFLKQKNESIPSYTNGDIAEIKLGSVPKEEREAMKTEREHVLSVIMTDYKIPIKEIFLSNFVRKVKPHLQTDKLEPGEDVGVEGVVLSDKNTGDQVKIVDKDVFTAINTFNNFIRSNISGLVRTDDQDAPIELRGGAFGQAKIRIAELLGVKELAVSSSAKKIITSFKGSSSEETAAKIANSLNIESFQSFKTKISAILKNAVEEVDEILEKFKSEAGSYKLKLKTGKEIGLSQEVMRRNLTAFAETKQDINQINQAVLRADDAPELVMALYGRTIQSLFNGNDDMKESKFNLIKSLSEDDEVSPAPATVAADIAPVEKLLFKGKRIVQKRARKFIKKSKFARESVEGKSLLKIVEDEIANQFATDVDDTAAAKKDIEFKQLRNNVNVGDDVTSTDVSSYLNKAHELNDEVDTVTYGMELDDGSIVKVYVNANQADEFEEALSQMLGEFDDIEEVINTLAGTFDIVDVEWPTADGNAPGSVPASDELPSDPLAPLDGSDPQIEPSVDPVINIGNEEPIGGEAPAADGTENDSDGGDLSIDTTTFDDEPTDGEDETGDADETDNPVVQVEPSDSEPVEPAIDDSPADKEGDDTSPEDSEDDTDATDGEDDSPDDDPDAPKKKKKKKSPDDGDDSDVDTTEKPNTEESAMTLGNRFKQRLLAEKAPVKKPKKVDAKKKDEDDLPDHHDTLPPALKKLLTSFPTRGAKAMIVMMYALGAPVDALVLKKAELRDSVEEAGDQFMRDSQFRMWTKRLTDELFKSQQPTNEAALEDEMSGVVQRIIIEVMQKIGLPASVERIARSALRTGIRNTAKRVMGDAKIRQYLKIIGEMLGVDTVTGMVKEGKNHMGETEYNSYASWKAAAKKVNPEFWIDGDKDIAQAMVGEKPFKAGKTKSIGEWDGAVGCIFKQLKENRDDDGLPEDPSKENGGFKTGQAVKAAGKPGKIKKFGGDCVYVTHDDGKTEEYDISELSEAMQVTAVPGATDDGTGNVWVDEVLKLVAALGIPEANLDYRRNQVEIAVKKQRMNLKNVSMVMKNVQRLNQLIGTNVKEDTDVK